MPASMSKRILPHLVPRTLLVLSMAAALVLLAGCAARSIIPSYEVKLLTEADSLFRTGNFEYAKVRYAKLRNEYPHSNEGSRAQYNLGYINVYYDNPFSNWDNALREFKIFAAMYPDHPLIPEVNSWIRMLLVLQSVNRQYDIADAEVASLEKELAKAKQDSLKPTRVDSKYDVLMEAVQRCYAEKDSLGSRIRVLEEVIDKIGKNP